MDNKERLQQAGNDAASALRSLQSAAAWLDRVTRDAPELTKRLDAVGQQLWAMADVARGVEAQVAEVHAELRAAK